MPEREFGPTIPFFPLFLPDPTKNLVQFHISYVPTLANGESLRHIFGLTTVTFFYALTPV
jgi:hypothetical protein